MAELKKKEKNDLIERLVEEEKKKFDQIGIEEYIKQLRSDTATYGTVPEDAITTTLESYEKLRVDEPFKGLKPAYIASLSNALADSAVYALGAAARRKLELGK